MMTDRHNDERYFEPLKNLVEIEIFGEKTEVPENNPLLRCFQYLSMETDLLRRFLLERRLRQLPGLAGKSDKDKPVLACRTKVQENMKIVKMCDEIELNFNFLQILLIYSRLNNLFQIKISISMKRISCIYYL